MKAKRPQTTKLGIAMAVIVTVVGVSAILEHEQVKSVTITASAPHLLAAINSASSTISAASSSPTTKTAVSATKIISAEFLNQSSTTSVDSSVQQARDLNASGSQLLRSVVNIVCLSGDSSVPSVTGSGVIIDSRGIILTAAHVAQMFLLQDYLGTSKVECLVRTGSPARRAYLAEPIYVSKTWLNNNPNTLTSSDPMGTGQNDVALLGITGTATSTPLPNSYPFTPLAPATAENPQVGDKVAIASYGAQYLTGDEINYSLYPILTFGSIENRYTFGSNTEDLISVTGNAASQEGSSGGGISNSQGQLIGVITTSIISGSFNTRLLNAITPLHLRESYLEDTGNNLDYTLQSENVSELIANFASQSKILGGQLMNDIVANGK